MEKSIITDRCKISPLNASDREAFIALYLNEQVREFLGGISDPEKSATRFEEMLFEKEAIHCSVRLKGDNSFVGLINIDKHYDGVEYEVSYQFIPNYWGKGLAQETVKAAIEYGLSALSKNVILAETQTKNKKQKTKNKKQKTKNKQSNALLVKLGFKEIDRVVRFDKMQSIYEYRI